MKQEPQSCTRCENFQEQSNQFETAEMMNVISIHVRKYSHSQV
jgi:hypothetical protein